MKIHIWKYFHRNEIGFGIFYSHYDESSYLQFTLLFWGFVLQFVKNKKPKKRIKKK